MLKVSIQAGQDNAKINSSLMPWNQLSESGEANFSRTVSVKHGNKQAGTARPLLSETDGDFDNRSKLSNASMAAEEAEVYPQNRMLQDSTGRLRKLASFRFIPQIILTRNHFCHLSNRASMIRDDDGAAKEYISQDLVLLPITV